MTAFPVRRLRRLRQSPALRRLVASQVEDIERAVRDGKIRTNPCEGTRLPDPTRTREPRFLSAAEFAELRDADAHTTDARPTPSSKGPQ